MKAFLAVAAIVIGFGAFPPALRADSPPLDHPWGKALAVTEATEADARAKGIKGIHPHVADLESLLVSAKTGYVASSPAGGPVYKLVDGSADALEVLAAAATDKTLSASGRKTEAIKNPYILASFYLGSYYNEVGKSAEALRVLDAGLALPQVDPALAASTHRPFMISERGAALGRLRRWPEAVADYDMGLSISGLAGPQRGLLLRGKGYALTEAGRLDDAEKAYRDSLAVDPNNAIATRELTYIAKLRAGGPKAPSGLFTPRAPKPAQP